MHRIHLISTERKLARRRLATVQPAVRNALVMCAAMVALAGCAALEQHRLDYQAALEGWIGATETELVSQFGNPERVTQVGASTKVLHWRSSHRGQTARSQDGGGLTMTLHCDLSFRLVDGKAESFEWRSSRGWMEHPERQRVDTLTASPCSEDFPTVRSGE